MGLEVGDPGRGETSVSGRLSLSSMPFEALDGALVAREARFFTLGHSRLKFFEPLPFFSLPALDVGRVESREQIEAALRREWAASLRRIEGARAWLAELGAPTAASERGTRLELELQETEGARAEVLSRQAILLPSVGPLRGVRALRPSDRLHRPLRGLEHAFELDIGISQAMEEVRRRCASGAVPGQRARSGPSTPEARSVPPTLLLLGDAAERAVAESTLRDRGLAVEAIGDPLRALEAFARRTFAAAVIDARLPRTDGVELAVRLAEVAGMESLPVLILDDRPTHRVREAARAAGAAGYVTRPIIWSRMAETLLDLVDHWTKRRFRRFGSRLGVVVESDPAAHAEVTQEVGQGGMRLCSRRDLALGALERYRIRLPPPHGSVRVDGEIVWRQAEPGCTLLHAGIRFFRFLEESEPSWIDLMKSLGARGDPTAA
jgi:two-component system chemotaxis response regulator CheY